MILDYFLTLPFRLVKDFCDFLSFWYVKSSRDFWRREVSFLKGVENEFGIRVNLKLLTQPIYGDYTVAGKIIGPIFRFLRVTIGCGFLLLSFGAVLVCYLLWLIFPPLAFYMTAKNLFYTLFL